MGKSKNPRFSFGCFVLLLIGFIGLIGSGWFLSQIPSLAEAQFGFSSSRLDLIDRYWYSLRLIINQEDLVTPLNDQGSPRVFVIQSGETAEQIALRLQQEGLIRNAEAFRDYMVYSGLDTAIQAGEYEISPAWNAIEIGHHLLDATPDQITFVILAGWRIEEIAASLPTSGLQITPEEFLQFVRNPPVEWHPGGRNSAGLSLEGYLFPGEYRFRRDASVREVVAAFLERFNQQVDANLREAFSRQGLTLHEAVTLASIVQREGVVEEERPMIASVFYNRLRAGMKLDADPTVQYALGYNSLQQTWWTNPLSHNDLMINSPYNTYQNTGLPPTPICNPSLSALQAVAYPADSPYFYFRARCDGLGRHSFAKTFEEHLQNACP
ncbi:MAG: aminodeoxychorismate lyase [Bellilinea sp.]|nr:MAG: aminodeoxychorismate lyase [Bellilinea sp.]